MIISESYNVNCFKIPKYIIELNKKDWSYITLDQSSIFLVASSMHFEQIHCLWSSWGGICSKRDFGISFVTHQQDGSFRPQELSWPQIGHLFSSITILLYAPLKRRAFDELESFDLFPYEHSRRNSQIIDAHLIELVWHLN